MIMSSVRLSEKETQVSDLQAELAEIKESMELHRKKNDVGFLYVSHKSCNKNNCSDLKPRQTSSSFPLVWYPKTPLTAYIHCPLPLFFSSLSILFLKLHKTQKAF